MDGLPPLVAPARPVTAKGSAGAAVVAGLGLACAVLALAAGALAASMVWDDARGNLPEQNDSFTLLGAFVLVAGFGIAALLATVVLCTVAVVHSGASARTRAVAVTGYTIAGVAIAVPVAVAFIS